MNGRAIKFRVWDGEKHKMFPVRELFWRENPYEMVGNYWDFKNKHDQYGEAVYFPSTDFHGVQHDNFILMQYTGLTDRNGIEIYEGDIVQSLAYGFKGGVFFENGAFWVREYGSSVEEGLFDDIEKETRWSINLDYEIIGNLYETPELIPQEVQP